MITKLHKLIAECDRCGKKSEPYESEEKLTLPDGWSQDYRWSYGISGRIYHFCSEHCDKEHKRWNE